MTRTTGMAHTPADVEVLAGTSLPNTGGPSLGLTVLGFTAERVRCPRPAEAPSQLKLGQ